MTPPGKVALERHKGQSVKVSSLIPIIGRTDLSMIQETIRYWSEIRKCMIQQDIPDKMYVDMGASGDVFEKFYEKYTFYGTQDSPGQPSGKISINFPIKVQTDLTSYHFLDFSFFHSDFLEFDTFPGSVRFC